MANFWPIKDQITLIKAVELLLKEGFEDIKVTFIGTGVTRTECEEYVQRQELNNYFEFKAQFPSQPGRRLSIRLFCSFCNLYS